MKINITFEQALAKASPRLRKRMEHTRDIILKAVPLALKYDPDKGFFVGFSGGKDSQALYHMMQLCDVPMHAYFSPTSIDPAENIRFIRKNYPEVEFTKIDKSIFDVFREMKVLPSMRIRWCCAYFKERGGEGKVVCTGVRKAESVRRSKRNEIEVSGRKFSGHMDEFEQWQEKRIRKKMKNINQDQFSDVKQTEVRCINGKDKILLNPIIEWSEDDVWEFLNKVVEVPHCELYDEGYTRIGCIGCPMATTKNQIKRFLRWPHVKEKWIRAIMDVRRESILANTPPIGRDLQLLLAQRTLPSPTGEQHSELDKELGWSDGHKQNIAPPQFPQFASQYTRMQTARTRFSQSVQQLQDRILERSSIIGGGRDLSKDSGREIFR